ncbi:MAG: DUF488 domain-containing protein [Thermodesulfovibrionales bacterium]|jgi:uncharacterized protein (DUF488 family)|nr:DUF488 domain-containing protein [Thermodesulfovibrionales bacterium]
MNTCSDVLYTIGFTGKSAEEFFTLLKKAGVKTLLDIRLNNVSQLAGFTKGKDLAYFVKEILQGQYVHLTLLSPTKEMLKKYQADEDWESYEKEYLDLLGKRRIIDNLDINLLKGPTVLLCSEKTADKCHRRLAAEYIQKKLLPECKIVHL